PALDLEQALDGVLVLTQQPGNGTVASIRQIGDHPLYPRRQVLIDPGFGLGRLIVITAAGHTGPAAGLHHRHDIALGSHLGQDLKSTRLNSSHVKNSYAVFCLKKKKYYKNT